MYDTQTHVRCSVAESAILARMPFFKQIPRSELRSDNRGTDNRGRTVRLFLTLSAYALVLCSG